VLVRVRRGDNTAGQAGCAKKQKTGIDSVPGPPTVLPVRVPGERVDIADCLTQSSETLPLECLGLLEQDLMHPVDVVKYSKQKLGMPVSLPFPLQWLKDFSFLEYSKKCGSFYCRYCSLGFAPGTHEGALITEAFSNFRYGSRLLRLHEQRSYHVAAVTSGTSRSVSLSGLPPDNVVPYAEVNTVDDFPPSLLAGTTSVVKTTIFNGRQGFSFRKTESVLVKDFPYSVEHLYTSLPWGYGSFEAALLFRLDSGDINLLRHLKENEPKFISNRSQNKILGYIFDDLQQQILAEATTSPFYSIILDGSVDASGKDQMTFVVRFLANDVIKEQFLVFIDVSSSTTGE
jgi:Domain of unknown function (DUF4371)